MSNESLLEIQRLDVEADRLRKRRETLEQRTALAEAQAEQQRQQNEIDGLQMTRVEITTRQKRFEDEAQTVSDRADADDSKLYGGEVSGMKDLQALQDEIAGLRSRQAELEDEALAAMEEADGVASRIGELETARSDVDARIDALVAEIADLESQIDGEIADLESERAQLVADTDDALVADYERLRGGLGSATVVRFSNGRCVGCPSAMPAMEVDRMKHEPAGSVQHCEECGRIVVL